MRKLIKRFSLVIVFVLIISMMASCSPAEKPDENEPNTIPENTAQNNTASEDEESDTVYYAYDQLTENEKSIYNSLLEDVLNYSVEFSFTNVDDSSLSKAYLAVIADHPEFFWLSGGYSYKTVTRGEQTEITLSPITMDMSSVRDMSDTFEILVDSIIAQANAMRSDFEKILYIHDYIVDNTQYDNDAYDLISSGSVKDTVLDSSTAYGCLVKGKAVCSGYSAAFQYLAQRLGYKCARAAGTKIGGENHEWNYILLDDEYYYVDVTWDDPVSADSSSNSKSHEFFCITTDELLMTRTIAKDQDVPNCSGIKYNYYYYNGLYLEEYSFEAVKNIVNTYLNAERIEIKFSSASECQKAQKDLIEDMRIFDISDQFNNGVSYSVGTSGLILSIIF